MTSRMRYRSRTDIAAEILKIAENGTSKTRIMYGAFLSYRQVTEYLDVLTGNGMIAYDKRLRNYKTTAMGLKFCQAYEEIGVLYNPE